MPHMMVGYGNIRFLALFGFGNKSNIAYAALSTLFSISLFSWKYGIEGWQTNGIYVGAVGILIIYWVTGQWVINFFKNK